MELKKITKLVEKQLDSKRYEHVRSVEFTAAAMAMKFGADVESALIAGILHDCAKNIPNEKKLSICEKNNLPVSDTERANPDLLHGKVGAYLAKTEYEVEDEDILNAITYHTTGRPGMSLLEKIIFVADYIEPLRKPLPDIDNIRRAAFEDIDLAVYLELKNVLTFLDTLEKEVDEVTNETFEYYKSIVE